MWHPFRRTPPRPEAPTWEDMLVEMQGRLFFGAFADRWKCGVNMPVVGGNLEIEGKGKRPSDAVYDAYETFRRVKGAA